MKAKFHCICTKCKKPTNEAFMVDNGEDYYCSEKCLKQVMSIKEWSKLVRDDENSFWTTWESQDEFFYDKNGKEVN